MTRPGLAAVAILCMSCAGDPRPGGDATVYELTNGRWYVDGVFVDSTFFVVGDRLRAEPSSRVDSTIDLAGGYVVPAFGEAHSHRPASPAALDAATDLFLDAGIFFVMNHGSLARYAAAFDSLTGGPGRLDVAFAHGLIASPQSHGVELWQRLVRNRVFPDVAVETLDGDAYFTIDSAGDLDRQWPRVLATRSDFIKIMVEYSEEYAARRADPRFFGRSGLDPALVPDIVRLARAAGLRVSAHIETAADFRTVVEAGADLVAHLPGYNVPLEDDVIRYRIDDAAAAVAARNGTIVITTTMLSVDFAEGEPVRLERMRNNQRENLRTLAAAGVRFAIGSDQFSTNAVDEALNLLSLGIFDNAMMLDLLSSATPRAIFPDRAVGALADGYEASFLVLGGDPLEDFSHVRDIRLRFKEGGFIPPSSP